MNFPRFVVPALMAVGLSGAVWADDYVVVVGAKSSVSSLTSEQVMQIFLGKVDTFPGGGAAVPIDQPASSGLRGAFSTKVLGKSEPQLKAYWSKIVFTGAGHPPREAPSTGDVKSLVANTPGGIGYIEKSAVDGTVKVVFSGS